MTTEPNNQSISGSQLNIPGTVTGPVVGGNVEHLGDKYVILPADRPPLWIDVPSLPAHFLGRDAIVADLSARLTAGGNVALSAEGKPGVGKTTLAVALAHHRDVLSHFSDGVLWAGLGPQPDLPSRLARWADALGLDISDRPTVEARAQAVRDAIGHRKLLLVIDDAWQLEAAKHLRCGGPNCAHLLTSRDQRLPLQFAGRSARVQELTPGDALELLRRLAPKAVAVDEIQVAGLLAAVGYLPLAVELLGGYLAAGASARFADASRSALADLTDPARRLALATRRLGDGTGVPVSLQETIALSIDGLAEESPAAVDVFYSLGAFAPKPANFDLTAAQAVAEWDGEDAGTDALALLIERNLLEQNNADESVSLHQTLADVARTRTSAEVVVSHREHYLERVNADREDWQMIESVYLQIQWAWQQTPPADPLIVEIVDVLSTYQTRLGLWEDLLKWLAVALTSAEQNDDAKSQARMLNGFGFVYDTLGEKAKALGYYEQALPLAHQVGDGNVEAMILSNIGIVYADLGEKEKALGYYEEALPQRRQVEDRSGEATTLNNVGMVYHDLGEKKKALGYYSEALSLWREVGDQSGEATSLNNIGAVYQSLGEMEKALVYYDWALPLYQQVGDRRREAGTLTNIGLVYNYMGEKVKSLEYYDRALPLYRQMRDRSGEAGTLNNIGSVYWSLGEMERALEYYEDALPLRRQVGDRSGEAATLTNIGTVYSALEEKEKALGYFEEALLLSRQVMDRSQEAAALTNIGTVYLALGEKEKALECYEQALPLFLRVENRFGERATRFEIAVVFVHLGRLAEAEQQMEIVVQIDEAVGHPNLVRDHQALEEVRAMRR